MSQNASQDVNATITVAYKGQTVVIDLDGTELSETRQRDGSLHRYLTNASRDFISDQVEKALIAIVSKEA
jgi:hypothetical protein